MDMFEYDLGEICRGPDIQRRVTDRIASANDSPAADGAGSSEAMAERALGARLREELILQARARLPVTYLTLARRVVASSATGAIRNALERLMDDDAEQGRPLLVAVAVQALEPGLPGPWFFRKAERIGLFAGDPADVEAYAFHAREFHRVIRFHARPPDKGQGPGRSPNPVAPLSSRSAGRKRSPC